MFRIEFSSERIGYIGVIAQLAAGKGIGCKRRPTALHTVIAHKPRTVEQLDSTTTQGGKCRRRHKCIAKRIGEIAKFVDCITEARECVATAVGLRSARSIGVNLVSRHTHRASSFIVYVENYSARIGEPQRHIDGYRSPCRIVASHQSLEAHVTVAIELRAARRRHITSRRGI